jgi:hypothetical protein
VSPSKPQPQRPTRPVVTIFESYGSGAEEIGPRVAEALGVAFHAQAFSSDQLEEPAEQQDEGLLSRVFAPARWSWTPVSTSSSTPAG